MNLPVANRDIHFRLMVIHMRLSSSLSKLELFVKVVENGSLSKAARALNLTPSAVSKALALLEGQLGTTLIWTMAACNGYYPSMRPHHTIHSTLCTSELATATLLYASSWSF